MRESALFHQHTSIDTWSLQVDHPREVHRMLLLKEEPEQKHMAMVEGFSIPWQQQNPQNDGTDAEEMEDD